MPNIRDSLTGLRAANSVTQTAKLPLYHKIASFVMQTPSLRKGGQRVCVDRKKEIADCSLKNGKMKNVEERVQFPPLTSYTQR